MSQIAPPHPKTKGQLLSRIDAGGGFQLVTLDVGAVAQSHAIAGQYVWVELNGAGGYFALAGRTGGGAWQVVVKPDRGAALELARAENGAAVAVTAALGGGYPCDALRGAAVVVAMPVSAIAAARGAMLQRLDDGDAARTTLLLGARERAEVPLARELDDFRAAGAEVVVCLSREQARGEGGYADGYVQDAARERAGAATVAYFVAGQTKAETGVRALALALSAPVYSNY
jgi:NAD(P)H-flavin reductase